MVEDVQVESEEGGFVLVLSGDMVAEFDRYLLNRDGVTVRLPLPGEVALQLLREAQGQIGPWAAEREQAQRETHAGGNEDPGEGYDVDDPKHPGYRERMAEHADLARKQAKENR